MASRRTGIAAVQPLKEAAMRAAGAARPGAQPRAPVRTMGGAFAAVSRRSGSPAPAGALAALIGRNMQAHTVVAPPARPSMGAAGPGGARAARGFSSGADNDVVIYSSKFESVLRAISAGSVAQGGVCTLMAAAVSLHPAAADSSLLPGWTASGRGALSGALIGFGAAVVLGSKGFLSKQILKVATIPSAPDDINVYVLSFPFGSAVHRVPKKEFYVITAAFGEFDLDKEANGPAPILPVYVGGSLGQTLMMDVRGDFLDKVGLCESMCAYSPLHRLC